MGRDPTKFHWSLLLAAPAAVVWLVAYTFVFGFVLLPLVVLSTGADRIGATRAGTWLYERAIGLCDLITEWNDGPRGP